MIERIYEIADFEQWVEKAKVESNLPLLEEVHEILLEYLTYLQKQHERNIRNRNFSLKKQIEKVEDLNITIFSIYSYFDSHTKSK